MRKLGFIVENKIFLQKIKKLLTNVEKSCKIRNVIMGEVYLNLQKSKK